MPVSTVFIIILAAILVVGLAALFYRLSSVSRLLTETKALQDADKTAIMIKEDLKTIHERMDRQTDSVQKSIQSQLGESAKIVREVTEKLTKLDETNKQVVGFADQLRQLQDILKNPKQRGVLGEYYLETLLKNVMPPDAYQMQYKFKDGEIVDAVVFVKEKIIPIDSKFSLENYNRLSSENEGPERARLEKLFINDLKLRIQETAKYIRPAEGTLEFAFMFIPHEAIYYELLVNKIGAVEGSSENLIQRAAGTYHVIIVSPTSFLAYLQTVLQGLRAMQIEESAKDILKNVGQLQRHMQVYDGFLQKLGNTMSTAATQYNAAYKEFKKIDKDVVKITEVESTIDPLVIEGPNRD